MSVTLVGESEGVVGGMEPLLEFFRKRRRPENSPLEEPGAGTEESDDGNGYQPW